MVLDESREMPNPYAYQFFDEFQEISDLYSYRFSTPEASGEVDSRGLLTIDVTEDYGKYGGVPEYHRVPAMMLEQVGYSNGTWTLRYLRFGPYSDYVPVNIQVRVLPESRPTFQRLSSSLELVLWLVRGFPHQADERVQSRALNLIRLVHRGSVSRDEATHQLCVYAEEVDIEQHHEPNLSAQSLADLRQFLDMFRHGLLDWPDYVEKSWDVLLRSGHPGYRSGGLLETIFRSVRQYGHQEFFAPVNDIDIRAIHKQRKQHDDMIGEVYRQVFEGDE